MATNQLFKKDLKDYDLLQLENWIRRCRVAIKKDNFKDSNTAEADYKRAVLDFMEEWKEHFKDEKNKDIYVEDNFRMAILANGVNLDRIVLELKKGRKIKRIDITEILYDKYLNNDNLGVFKNLMDDYTKSRLEEINKYFDLISDLDYIDDYKKKIVELIRNKTKYNIQTLNATVDDSSIFEIENIEELIDALITDINQDLETLEKASEEFPLLKSFEGYDITRQTFYDFEDEANDGTYEKNYEKKFFINVGFYLSLNFELFEMFLSLFGYTIEKSRTSRDRILTEFISIGFSKEYIDISIEANNLNPLTPRVAGYQKRDINYINEFLKKTTYTTEETIKFRFTLEYAMTKLTSFINHKEEMKKRAIHKLGKLEKRIKLEEVSYLNSQNELETYEFENYEDENNYKNEISKNRQKIRRLESKDVISLEDKKEIRKLKERNKDLTINKTKISVKLLELNKIKNESLRKLKNTERSLDNTKNKISRLENTKYKSIDFFKEHLEEYNNLTLSEVRDLLKRFEALYNEDYKL